MASDDEERALLDENTSFARLTPLLQASSTRCDGRVVLYVMSVC